MQQLNRVCWEHVDDITYPEYEDKEAETLETVDKTYTK